MNIFRRRKARINRIERYTTTGAVFIAILANKKLNPQITFPAAAVMIGIVVSFFTLSPANIPEIVSLSFLILNKYQSPVNRKCVIIG